ncbi:MAG: DinB family protein [Saprospiraceae bacterium]|nr:DinB family protein [Saprospiraceae bacterium]
MTLGEKLTDLLQNHLPILGEISERSAGIKPTPDKWSAKEILGHLIDSACNNHRRFIIAQSKDDLVFDGYEQEMWVKSQYYQDASWQDLITLWKSYNQHLARIIDCIPEQILRSGRGHHSLDYVAWKTVSKSESTTLYYFIEDYINHMKHHLNQITEAVQSLR